MTKSFKEYLGLGGHRIGYIDNIKPMASLGDTPPKGQGGRDSRAVGLVANYTTQGVGTIKPINADAKKLQKKNWSSKGFGPDVVRQVSKKIKESTLYKHMVDRKIIKD
jgi:hypothetical protein